MDTRPMSEPVRHAAGTTSSSSRNPRRTWVLVAACAASFIVALDLLVVTTALDTIRTHLGASPEALQWTVTAYGVTFAALLMTGAALGDRFGRRRMLATGLAVFALGSAASALSGSVGFLIGSRVIQGVGGALIVPIGLTVVTAAFPADRRGAAIGILEGVTGLAVLAGPVVGGFVTESLAWQWIFWLNVPIAVAAIPLVLAVVEDSHGSDPSLDSVGLLLVSTAAFAVVWGLVRGNDAGWLSAEILAALVGGVVLAMAFVRWELRVDRPMLPMRFFSSRPFSVGAAASFLLVGSLYGSVFFMAQFIQIGLGEDALGAGLRLLPWTGVLFVTAPIAGQIADRVGHRLILSTGLLLQSIGIGWLAVIADAGMSYTAMIGPLVVAGVGTSAALPVSQAAIVGAVKDSEVGKAAGTNNMIQELGGAFGVAATVAVFAAAGSYASPEEFAGGFTAGMGMSAALAGAGFIAALGLPRRSTVDAAPGVAVSPNSSLVEEIVAGATDGVR